MITQDANKQLTPAVQTHLLLRDAAEVDLGVSVAELALDAAPGSYSTYSYGKYFQLRPAGGGRFVGRRLAEGETHSGLVLDIRPYLSRCDSLAFCGDLIIHQDESHGLRSGVWWAIKIPLHLDSISLEDEGPMANGLRDASLSIGLANNLRTLAQHLEEEVSDQWL